MVVALANVVGFLELGLLGNRRQSHRGHKILLDLWLCLALGASRLNLGLVVLGGVRAPGVRIDPIGSVTLRGLIGKHIIIFHFS